MLLCPATVCCCCSRPVLQGIVLRGTYKFAGMRTMSLVAVGATIFTLCGDTTLAVSDL